MTIRYKRVLLKLSGEALMGNDAFGINRTTIMGIVGQIVEIAKMGRGSGRGGWRRQPVSRCGRAGQRYGPRHCRLHGHARHGDERSGLERCV